MTKTTRRQLTLFLPAAISAEIESTREKFNPAQHALIAGHVTLCRDEEVDDTETLQRSLQLLHAMPVTINFGKVKRSGNGVLLPAEGANASFHSLRREILGDDLKKMEPHITLIHPRNGVCTDEIFEEISQSVFPTEILFDRISLVEKVDDEPWKVLAEFNFKRSQ